VIFDRSWYNRAGVERVMGFTSEEAVTKFLNVVPLFEKMMIESGILLFKYWLEVSPEEQTRRLKARIDDGRKIWKLSPMDLKSYSRWYDYSRRATRCSRRPTLRGRRGSWPSPRTRSACGSTSSRTFEPHPVRGADAREGQAAEAPDARKIPGAGLPVQSHRGKVLRILRHRAT
jgi:hypothetical protein